MTDTNNSKQTAEAQPNIKQVRKQNRSNHCDQNMKREFLSAIQSDRETAECKFVNKTMEIFK